MWRFRQRIGGASRFTIPYELLWLTKGHAVSASIPGNRKLPCGGHDLGCGSGPGYLQALFLWIETVLVWSVGEDHEALGLFACLREKQRDG